MAIGQWAPPAAVETTHHGVMPKSPPEWTPARSRSWKDRVKCGSRTHRRQRFVNTHDSKARWRQGDGVQHVKRSVEHKGATRNAPRHGLGLEARGIETGRRGTMEPKGKTTARRENEVLRS